jgi:hypothetical protein
VIMKHVRSWFFVTFNISGVIAIPALKEAINDVEFTAKWLSPLQHTLKLQKPLLDSPLPTGTCNAQTPCPIDACCGTNGLCGYSPSECGAGNCTSKCDSKAECGQYGVPGKQKCPLNVCCSQFGYVSRIRKFLQPLSNPVVF